MKPSSSEFHVLRSRRIHVRSWGNRSAPLLTFLHGWGDVSASWQFVVDSLAGDWYVVAPDWRGFGLSQWDRESYWFPDYVADLDALLDLYSPNTSVRIVGHSLGGNVASLYAGIRPDRVSGLVNLEGIGLPKRDAEDAPGRIAQWLDQSKSASTFRSYPSREAFAQRLQKENSRLSEEKAAFLALHMGEDDGAGGIRPAADPCHRWVNPVIYRVDEAKACWRKISAPVLWIAAADSVLFKEFFADKSDDYLERLACFSDRREIKLQDSGHNMHHDQPVRLAQLIEEFFAQ